MYDKIAGETSLFRLQSYPTLKGNSIQMNMHNRINTTKNKLKLIIIKCTLSLSIIGGLSVCAQPQQQKVEQLTFAIIGNTYPSSPFTGFTKRFPVLMNEIRGENPILLFHTGNIMQGGYDWMGIKEQDLERQCKAFTDELKDLASMTYTIAGTKDLLNDSSIMYKKLFNKKLYYSFNYGDLHFVVLNTIECKEFDQDKQLRWLQLDLEAYRFSRIIIFCHKPIFVPPGKGIGLSYRDTIHKILKNYQVLAVFSGSKTNYFEEKVDNVPYISVGCYGLKVNDPWWLYNHYYLVNYSSGALTITPKKITFK